MSLLHELNLPEDIKTLCKKDMEQLAVDIRNELIELKDKSGGHFASNMGVVEITLALHAIFDSPKDKFVWDVSHQTYVHKMLTKRLEQIYTIKQKGGLSGFAKITESPHDSFGAGHASTAMSAAMGMAKARDVLEDDYSVVAIMGDAALSGGMAYEAINNIGCMKKNFICILNDNDMSISPPVGSMATYFTQLRTTGMYDQMKDKFERICNHIPTIGVPLRRRTEKLVDRLRNTLLDVKAGVLFEEFGFKYLGPLDGHNVSVVMGALKYAKSYPGPIMIHLITKKGKGFEPAEDDPVKYHGVSPKKTGPVAPAPPSFTKIFGNQLCKLAEKHPKLVGITPAMREGSGMVEFSEQFPDRYFDVGIAEEHAVTFAAGMAASGAVPVLAIYSTFMQRGYDQLVHDVALQKLPVIFALDRAGLVGADGPTHHGILDINYMLPIPNMVITAPKDGKELEDLMAWAVDAGKIVSIRYPRGSVHERDGEIHSPVEFGKAEWMLGAPGKPVTVTLLAVGNMAWPSYEALQELNEKTGLDANLINLRFVKPLDMDCLKEVAQQSEHLIVLEDGQAIGGAHSYILQELSEKLGSDCPPIHSIAIPDQFTDHGTVTELQTDYNMAPAQLAARVQALISEPIPVAI